MNALSNILIVDDTLENLQVLGDMLRRHGYKVRPVPSGKLALQACSAQPPDIILLDINMPEMNGYEVCARLKEDERLKEIPVLFISALNESADKVKAFLSGGVDYITKPFQIEEVEARVATHLALRRQRQELQNSLTRIRELEETRKNLNRLIVHDLRNPLNAIKGFLEEVGERNAGMDDTSKNYLQRAHAASRNLLDMADSLLDLNRLEEGVMPLRTEPADLADVCREAVSNAGLLLGGRSVTVESEGEAPVAVVDRALIRRVIQNILGNALKFTDKEKGVIVLRAAYNPEKTGVLVSIKDNGPGIPAEYHKRIFEKFVQVEGTQIPGVHSTGLGLSLCKLAVEAHGGEIGVESNPGEGTTFRFLLPRVPPATAAAMPPA